MSTTIRIELPAEAVQIMARLAGYPAAMAGAVARGMDKGLQEVSGQMQRTRFTGKGPFPAEQGRLGVKTNRLRSSIHSFAAVVEGDKVTGGIGTNVEYMAIHEFGGVINRMVKAGRVRLRTTRSGALRRGETGGAVFAKKSQKAREVEYAGGGSYQITMPERAPIRKGMEENKALLTSEITASLRALWEGKNT